MKVAIIGMGISGSSVLKHLIDLNALQANDLVDVYEPRHEIGVGFAYQKDDEVLLMNSYSTRLSLNEDDPQEFMDWLSHNHPQLVKDNFVPRQIFGDYLIDKYHPYLGHPQVNLFKEEVINLEIRDDQKISVTTQALNQETYDWVFLMMGHPPYADHYNLIGNKNYIHNPYPVTQQLDHIQKDHKIGIIGSSLTGIDVMHYLQNKQIYDNPINFFIRYSPFTNVKSRLYPEPIVLSIDEEWIEKQKELNKGQIPLLTIYHQISQDMDANKVNLLESIIKYQNGSVQDIRYQINNQPIDLQIIQRYVGLLTAYLPELNMALSPKERTLFHQEYKRLFEHFRTQFPSEKMELILKWFDQDRIQIISHLKDIKANDGKFMITTRDNLKFNMDILINATGFEQNLEKAGQQMSLIHNLLNQEIIMQNPNGGILVTWPRANPISPRYGEIKNLALSGNIIHQTQFGNNNAQMTARHGKNLVKYFLEAKKSRSLS